MDIIEVPFPMDGGSIFWKAKEYGVRDDREFRPSDIRSLSLKIRDSVRAILREIAYSFKTFGKRILEAFRKRSRVDIAFKTNAQALMVFFHGLNGRESVWDDHLKFIQRRKLNFDLLTPALPKRGHAPLDGEGSYKIRNAIAIWARENPGKPIALFGQSRGSMYALQMEVWLREIAPQNPVFVSSTGGVLFGSRKINQIKTPDCAPNPQGSASIED